MTTSGDRAATGSAAGWSLTQIASATPTANVVAASSGYSPATPRIPSVPKSCLTYGLFSYRSDGQVDSNLRGRFKMYLRVIYESVYSLVAGLRQAVQIDGVSLNLGHGRDARL